MPKLKFYKHVLKIMLNLTTIRKDVYVKRFLLHNKRFRKINIKMFFFINKDALTTL